MNRMLFLLDLFRNSLWLKKSVILATTWIFERGLIIILFNSGFAFACENHPPRETCDKPLKKGAYDLMREASKSIIITSSLNTEILQILNQKAKEGIFVEIVAKKLDAAPLHPDIRIRTLEVTNQQILIIDESYVWMGSVNDRQVFSSKSSSIGYYSPDFASILYRNLTGSDLGCLTAIAKPSSKGASMIPQPGIF